MISRWLRPTVLATACAASIAATAGTAFARTAFDGAWSVVIVTDRGACDRAYRYGVQIIDGNVTTDAGSMVSIGGRVAPNGAVRVTVQGGGAFASGSGKLSRNVGSGSWSGRSGNDVCAGRWQAERRG
jgi:hypothetical protein